MQNMHSAPELQLFEIYDRLAPMIMLSAFCCFREALLQYWWHNIKRGWFVNEGQGIPAKISFPNCGLGCSLRMPWVMSSSDIIQFWMIGDRWKWLRSHYKNHLSLISRNKNPRPCSNQLRKVIKHTLLTCPGWGVDIFQSWVFPQSQLKIKTGLFSNQQSVEKSLHDELGEEVFMAVIV